MWYFLEGFILIHFFLFSITMQFYTLCTSCVRDRGFYMTDAQIAISKFSFSFFYFRVATPEPSSDRIQLGDEVYASIWIARFWVSKTYLPWMWKQRTGTSNERPGRSCSFKREKVHAFGNQLRKWILLLRLPNALMNRADYPIYRKNKKEASMSIDASYFE